MKHFDFLAHAIKEWPLSIYLIMKLFLRRINGRIFERILLEYLFHILTKAKISSQDIYVSKHFTLVSEIQNFLYSEILNQPQAIEGLSISVEEVIKSTTSYYIK